MCHSILFYKINSTLIYKQIILHGMTSPHFVYSSVDGHLRCFHSFTGGELWCREHSWTSFYVNMLSLLLGTCLGMESPGHTVAVCPTAEEPARLFHHSCPILSSPAGRKASTRCTSLSTLAAAGFFDYSHLRNGLFLAISVNKGRPSHQRLQRFNTSWLP